MRITGSAPNPRGGLYADSGSHFLYSLDGAGLPQCLQHRGGRWVAKKVGDEPLTRLLGVDPRRHLLFGYDAAARGIRAFHYNANTRSWRSSIIATGLGPVGDGAAIDSAHMTIYSTHETAAPSIHRHPRGIVLYDPTEIGKMPQWPLVATSWNGTTWNSMVLTDTGVPHQPALRDSDLRVFFALRDAPNGLWFYQAPRGARDAFFGALGGWSGADTYTDDEHYRLQKPTPFEWIGVNATSFGLIPTMISGDGSVPGLGLGTFEMRCPITLIPYYKFADLPLLNRLSGFRAVVNPRKQTLVQTRIQNSGEVLRQGTPLLAGYLYRDAAGRLAKELSSSSYNAPFREVHASFDAANPPASFAALTDDTQRLFGKVVDPAKYYLDPTMSSQLRLPTQVTLRTFGHNYSTLAHDQQGGRHRKYRNYGTDYAVPSGIAVDRATGITFYTQAPAPVSYTPAFSVVTLEDQSPYVAHPFVAESSYLPDPDPKHPRPTDAAVWIVMVYRAALRRSSFLPRGGAPDKCFRLAP